jgi:hypothetical protein
MSRFSKSFVHTNKIVIIQFHSIQSLYFSVCQELVAYSRRALKVYITKARLRLELNLELELD